MNFPCFIFDYGATIDTPGNHWGKVMWHAYDEVFNKNASADDVSESEIDVLSAEKTLTEERFREAYVYAERYLGSHDVIKPTDTFYTTLQTKIRLQLEFLNDHYNTPQNDSNVLQLLATPCNSLNSFNSLTTLLYSTAQQNIENSKLVLKELKSQGKRLGLVSNFYGNIQAVLEEFGLSELFEVVVESATEGIRKPDPRLLALCLERLHANPNDTIVVGDHLTKDVLPAKQLGCTTVWIKGEPWSDEHDALERVRPDHTITSLEELFLIG